MANWSTLKAAVAQIIKANNNQEITGANMRSVLNNIIDNVGENATYAGIARTSTNPGSPDGKVFYIAYQAGTFSNFGNVTLEEGINLLLWNTTSWQVFNILTIAQEVGSNKGYVMSQKSITNLFDGINTDVNLFNGEIEFAITESYPQGAFFIGTGNIYTRGNNIASVTSPIIVEKTVNSLIFGLYYDIESKEFYVDSKYKAGNIVIMTIYRDKGIKQSIATSSKYNGNIINNYYGTLDLITADTVKNIAGRGLFNGTIKYSTEGNSNGVFTISSGNLYIDGAMEKQFTLSQNINVDFSALLINLIYNIESGNIEASKNIGENFLIAQVYNKSEIRNSCAIINIVNGVTAKSIFDITKEVATLNEQTQVYDEYLSDLTKIKKENITPGTSAYLNFYNSGEFDVRKNDAITLNITSNNVKKYTVIAYNHQNTYVNIINEALPNQEYTVYAPFNITFVRAIINGSDIINSESITLNFTKNNKFVGIEHEISSIEEEVTELQNKSTIPANMLLNRYKPLYPINKEAISERPQSKFTSFKSFSPKIDYRGLVVFESFTDYTNFDTTKAIHFEEKFVFVNKAGNYPYTGVSYISSDLKEWDKYNHLADFNASVLGGTVNQSWGLASNEYGLLVFQTTYNNSLNQHVNCLFWSLDGGKTFEPAINNLRAKVTINKSELIGGKVINIDSTQITVTKAADIQSYLSSMSGDTSEALISSAKEYLNNKCILSNNGNDTLRSLAGLLIELGYKVMLSGEELTVYYKELGTAGNNQTFTIGETIKTFTGGTNYSNKDDILDACSIDYPITNIYYKGTENLIASADLVLDNSILYVNNKWHLFGHYYDGTRCSILDLIIDDITNLPDSSYQYKEVLSQNNNACVEPIATFNSLNNKIIVSFRNQSFGQPYKFVYSNDYGESWSDLFEIENSPKVFQANNAIFLVTNPKESGGTEIFYDRPSSDTFNMYVALMYDRRTNAIYAATADVEDNLEDLQWSDWVTLNRYNDNLNRLGFDDLGMYFSDYSGYSSIGDFCYAPAHRGIALLYTGMAVIGKKTSLTAYSTIETC